MSWRRKILLFQAALWLAGTLAADTINYKYDDAGRLISVSYGNGTSIFTESGAAVRKYSREIEVGMVGVNVGVAAPVAFFPFSGWKDSFLGDLHAHGGDAVDFYTRKKTITSRFFTEESGRFFTEQ